MCVCVTESEPPLIELSEQVSHSVLISMLRAELGLSSPDLFSMTVTDYDIKPNVRKCFLSFVFFYLGLTRMHASFQHRSYSCSHMEAVLFTAAQSDGNNIHLICQDFSSLCRNTTGSISFVTQPVLSLNFFSGNLKEYCII